jgi:hypothetical protein
MKLLLPLLALFLVGLGACAGSGWSQAPKVVFPITAEEADKVMYDAMVNEFGVASIHRMSYPQPGYRYAETTVKRVQTKGLAESGDVVTGYAFQSQGHRSEAVAQMVAQLASAYAAALPLAQ